MACHPIEVIDLVGTKVSIGRFEGLRGDSRMFNAVRLIRHQMEAIVSKLKPNPKSRSSQRLLCDTRNSVSGREVDTWGVVCGGTPSKETDSSPEQRTIAFGVVVSSRLDERLFFHIVLEVESKVAILRLGVDLVVNNTLSKFPRL